MESSSIRRSQDAASSFREEPLLHLNVLLAFFACLFSLFRSLTISFFNFFLLGELLDNLLEQPSGRSFASSRRADDEVGRMSLTIAAAERGFSTTRTSLLSLCSLGMSLISCDLLLLVETLDFGFGLCLITFRRFRVTGDGLFGTSNSVGTAFQTSFSRLAFINCESSKCLLHNRKLLFRISKLLQSRSKRLVLILHFLHLFTQNQIITAYHWNFYYKLLRSIL